MKRFTKHPEEWGGFLDIKMNAPEVLEKEIVKKRKGRILLGSVTDAYQAMESKYEITRKILEILLKHDFPLSILTKSPLVTRDIDILKKMKSVEVGLSISSYSDRAAKILEPGAYLPKDKIEALSKMKKEGIETYAFISPILPGITNLKDIIEALAGKIDYIMFEAINLRAFRVAKLHKVYRDLGIDISLLNNVNWNEIEKEARELSEKHNIPVKGFYRH